jgi:hypothetical protein
MRCARPNAPLVDLDYRLTKNPQFDVPHCSTSFELVLDAASTLQHCRHRCVIAITGNFFRPTLSYSTNTS